MTTYYKLASGSVIATDSPHVWESDPNAKRISAAKGKELLKAESLKSLREVLKPGDTVWCVLRHVSSSGMSRRIDFYTIRKGEPRFLTGNIGNALGYPHHKDGGLIVGGCGMDMGFHVVYELGKTLFPKGFVPAKANRQGRNGSPATKLDNDSGYALNHRWL